MEYQALYRKYRPQKFSDVVDQDSTLKIITNSLKEGHISHAYLFSGPRGTGKTTIAKLLAKTVNCLNLNEDFSICGKCENCLDIMNNSPDIIEIDAASNNGVDEIRELKSKINLVPNKLKYKVYIIDEVHMLSISAFNALLKTLEEPPSHVIFILATTEFYKVPETIVSRCQCLNFTRIKISSIEKRLKEIAEIENIKIADDAIHEIAEYSKGGMRDALGMLDKLASYSLDKITASDFFQINGLISNQDMDDFIEKILNKDNNYILDKLSNFDDLGYDFSKLIEKLMQECRDLMVKSYEKENKFNPSDLYKLIMCLNDTYNLLKESINRKIIFEVQLLKFMNNTRLSDTKSKEYSVKNEVISREIPLQSVDIKQKPKDEIKNEDELKEIKKVKKYSIDLDTKKQRINNTFALASKVLKNIALQKWKKINNYLVSQDYSYVAGLLKDSDIAVVSKNNIILTAKYESIIDDFYLNFNKINDLINTILEDNYKIVLLNKDEFTSEVKKYKEHMNDEGYYEYQEENKDFIKYLDIEKNDKIGYNNLVNKAINVLGTDIVEIEEEK